MSCAGCGLAFFLNPAVAVAAVIRDPGGRVLLIRRAKEPARDKLALPGGFVDRGETAEAALAREIREELGLEVIRSSFLVSHPNTYEYRGVVYPVLDFFFDAVVRSFDVVLDRHEVSGHELVPLDQIDVDGLAFESMRVAVRALRACQYG
jgi:mutator protein MutT